MASRKDSDEHYVIDLCDEILGLKASRQHTFDFLRGDGTPGKKLPVDAYYPKLNIVVEYRERQHTESVAFFNKTNTVSGVSRDEQRRIYDQRRRDVLPQHGIKLVEISYADLKHDSRKRLIRDRQADKEVLQSLLSQSDGQFHKEKNGNVKLTASHRISPRKANKQQVKDGTQTWVYRLYNKNDFLFIIAIVFGTIILTSYLTLRVLHLDEGLALFIVLIALFVVPFIFYTYTTEVDEKKRKGKSKRRKVTSATYNDADRYPICCPQCGSSNIGPTDTGEFVCMDCGISWVQKF
ncbi:MAG: TFIIB-type zinc ribbon-containing protein [Bacteroidaceae bacterium]|nr:TFIIB-type zinc ribbon-containing protein [Bacteroidaceae bacterium]